MERAPQTRNSCGIHAGKGGLLVTALFEGIIQSRNPISNQLVWSYLEEHTFDPSFSFTRVFELSDAVLVPWPTLFAWIPARVNWWAQELESAIPPHDRRVIRIAHRGASAYAQENSLSAIHKAAEMGADMVEVDVRLTADSVPVISHDENLKRVFGIEGSIRDFSLDELRAMIPDEREPLITLEQLAETCRSLRMGIYLDIKQIEFESAGIMFEVLKKHGMLNGTIFGSFRADWLAEIKAQEPDAQTSILFSSTHVEPVMLAQSVQCDYVHPCWERFEQPHTLLTPDWLARVRQAGLGIVCWHEERPSEIQALQALGVNAICSDEPERLVPESR
jgi:glycerophosphoryl diester phosphodiesterase